MSNRLLVAALLFISCDIRRSEAIDGNGSDHFACTLDAETCALYDVTASDLGAAVSDIGVSVMKPTLRGMDPMPKDSPSFLGLELDKFSLIFLDRSLVDWTLQCTLIHELGHAYGLSHTQTGIMSPTIDGCKGYVYEQAIDEVAGLIRKAKEGER